MGSIPVAGARKKHCFRSAFFNSIRLWRLVLLRSDIRLTPSDVRYASFEGE